MHVAELEAAASGADARAKDALAAAEKASAELSAVVRERDRAVAAKENLLREEAAAAAPRPPAHEWGGMHQPMPSPPPWGAGATDEQPTFPHPLMAAMFPREHAGHAPPFYPHAPAPPGGVMLPAGALVHPQHPLPMPPPLWAQPSAAPALGLLPPPAAMTLHGHEAFSGHAVSFGDFQQELLPAQARPVLPPPPGYVPQGAPQAAPMTPVDAPLSAAPGESAPNTFDEQRLVEVFKRAAPSEPAAALPPDVLLAKVEQTFMRPHTWATNYQHMFGSTAQFFAAHPSEFLLTSDGRVYRRSAAAQLPAPPVAALTHMMVTPLAPHVRGPHAVDGAAAPSATLEPPRAGDEYDARPSGGRGRGAGSGGRRRGGGSGRGRATAAGLF